MYFPVVMSCTALSNPADYLASLQTYGRLPARGVPPPAAAELRVPLSPVGLSVLTPDEGMHKLPPSVQAALAPQIKTALAHFSGEVPLAPGEEVEDSTIGALALPWQGLAAGTLVFLRRSNLATLACVIPGARIDLQTGALKADSGALYRFSPIAQVIGSGTITQDTVMLAADAGPGKDTKTIVDAALTAITFVGFGISGPWGLALAGAAAVAEVLFNAFFNTGEDPLAVQIGDVVKELLGQQEITDHANSIATSLSVFKQNWTEMKTMDQQQIDTLRDVASHQVQDTSDLNAALTFLSGGDSVNFMDTKDLQRSTLAVYGLGLSTKLLWIKLALLLDESSEAKGDKTKSGYLHTLVNVGDQGTAYLNTQKAAIEQELVDRVAAIGPCVPAAYIVEILGGGTENKVTAFEDSVDPWDSYTWLTSPSHMSEMSAPNTGCCSQNADVDGCNAKRGAYIAKVQSQITDKYHYDADQIATMIEQIRAVIDKYRAYLTS